MYKRFAFEGDIHSTLSCVPLTVRRKLDLAGFKVSLAGWQQLARDERLSLCHLPVDSEDDLAVYREVMVGVCQRHDVVCAPLRDPQAAARAWRADVVPSALVERLPVIGVELDDERWRALGDEDRYALLKLADPKRGNDKLAAALVELQLMPGPAPEIHPDAPICDPAREPSGPDGQRSKP